MKLIDLTGQLFGDYTVIERDPKGIAGAAAYWQCQCKCGRICSVRMDFLRSDGVKKCSICRQEENRLNRTPLKTKIHQPK